MLRSTEVRKGNFATDGNKLVCLTAEDILKIDSGLQSYRPIYLWSGWISDFGFTRHHDGYYNDVLCLKLIERETIGSHPEYAYAVYPNELGSAIYIQDAKALVYVHELQNLYHAITGKELILLRNSPEKWRDG